MKAFDFLDTLFSDSELTITDLKKGLTNKNYLLKTGKESYVLRVPQPDSAHIVNRHNETLALQAIQNSNIDAEMIYYDESSGYKVTVYLPDALTYQESHDPYKIEKTAQLMKNFHSLNKTIDIDFEPLALLKKYQSHIQSPLYDLSGYAHVAEEIQHLNNPKILCHNDWVDGNILFTSTRTYLIDYEYAGNNDPLFDVMSFISENQIDDPDLRERFYAVYFDEINASIRTQLDLWENFHNYLWCHWAMMMWESRHQEVYKNIAKDKFSALNKKCK